MQIIYKSNRFYVFQNNDQVLFYTRETMVRIYYKRGPEGVVHSLTYGPSQFS